MYNKNAILVQPNCKGPLKRSVSLFNSCLAVVKVKKNPEKIRTPNLSCLYVCMSKVSIRQLGSSLLTLMKIQVYRSKDF